MDRILELLRSITENSTIEEARRIIADTLDEAVRVQDDITALNNTINELKDTAVDTANEISRLKEENGRLYRDRVIDVVEKVDDKQDKVDDVSEEIARLESEIIL